MLNIGALNRRNVHEVGELKSLITHLFNFKISSHAIDWIDRWRLNMGHRMLLSI